MTLHTREFTVNGQKIIVGHDRETGKRYYLKDNQLPFEVKKIIIEVFTPEENYIALIDFFDNELVLFSDIENPEEVVAELKSIFWIK